MAVFLLGRRRIDPTKRPWGAHRLADRTAVPGTWPVGSADAFAFPYHHQISGGILGFETLDFFRTGGIVGFTTTAT